jgi:hypothetical protein
MSYRIGVTEIKRKLSIELGHEKRPSPEHMKQLHKAMSGIQKRVFEKDLPIDNFFYGVTIKDHTGTEFFLNMGNLDPREKLSLEALNDVAAWKQHASEWLDQYYLNVEHKMKAKYGTFNPLTGENELQESDWGNGIEIVEIQGKAVYGGSRHHVNHIRSQFTGRGTNFYYMRLQ